MKIDKHWAPFFIAAAIAIIAVIYYIVSGYSSYDLNVRQLNFGKTIDKIDASNTKKTWDGAQKAAPHPADRALCPSTQCSGERAGPQRSERYKMGPPNWSKERSD